MKRISAAALALLLLWALVPAVGELIENAVHFAEEGHAAHAAPDGDQHDPLDTEHGCAGAVHLCHCCASMSVLLTHSVAVSPTQVSEQLPVLASDEVPALLFGGVYHPPRA